MALRSSNVKPVRIINHTRKTVLADRAVVADTPATRMTGLLRHASLDPGEGMIFTHCRSIHMFFMKFPIDVVFIDHEKKVVALVRSIKPFRMSGYYWRSQYAIELPVGQIDKTLTQLKDTIFWN